MNKKSKYLILQLDIDSGTQWGNEQTINPIRNIFIPSVKKYCKKYDYDYSLIKKISNEDRYGNFDFLDTKEKHYSFERYFHFNNNYDYTIYLDNDIYIFPDAQPIPEFKGLRNAPEPDGNSAKKFREVNNLDNSCGYYNSGVTFCDNFTANKLSNYMINRLDKRDRPKGKNTDNMMLNEFIIENKKIFNEIGSEWNYMPFLPNVKKITKPNFFHFVGVTGKGIINSLIDKNVNIENFLTWSREIK